MSKVECEVTAARVEFKGRQIDGVEVTCSRCDHFEQAGGTGDASVKRCLMQLRENCPRGERNFYVAAED